ncbi:hypothetical protein QYM36_003900 [Artemia franciscana]|nr:hypothetical protein QYM36_003900 [Artemia franciscana]KAK2721743.1 hypothetical protein QYM36_003900 [Artemia franciscana]
MNGTTLTLETLDGLNSLQKLDLRKNLFSGSLGSNFLDGLRKLEVLDMSVNNITALRRGMLNGLEALSSLKLSYNQIDVIEDQAFINLKNLLALDLSHNRIVSVSTGSWTGLSLLKTLDLSHNYLRTIAVDLTVGLTNLKTLVLADNDITGIRSGSLQKHDALENLVLTDNPLSCDCQIRDFVEWLQENDIDVDGGTAVCATPPELENAHLSELKADMLTCTSEEFSSEYDSYEPIISSTGVLRFVNLTQDGAGILVEWDVQTINDVFSCDLLFIYSVDDTHETLIEQLPLSCDSTKLEMSSKLKLMLLAGAILETNSTYRLCLVLLEHHSGDNAALLPSCTDNFVYTGSRVETEGKLAFIVDSNEEYESYSVEPRAELTAFHANVTEIDTISIFMRISTPDCLVYLGIFEYEKIVLYKILNCSVQSITFRNIPTGYFDYEVCTTFENQIDYSSKSSFQQCVITKSPWSVSIENIVLLVAIGFFFMLISILILIFVYFLSRKIFFPLKPALVPNRKSPSRSILYPSMADNDGSYIDDLRQPRPFEISATLIQI